jgi:hypothetical protein
MCNYFWIQANTDFLYLASSHLQSFALNDNIFNLINTSKSFGSILTPGVYTYQNKVSKNTLHVIEQKYNKMLFLLKCLSRICKKTIILKYTKPF